MPLLRFIRSPARLGVTLLVAAAIAGCDNGSPTESMKGPLGRVVSPNGAEGAAIVEFAGVVDSVAVSGGRAYLQTTGASTRAAIVLTQPGALRFSLPTLAPGSGPAATVIEVADGNNQLRPTVAGYRVTYDR